MKDLKSLLAIVLLGLLVSSNAYSQNDDFFDDLFMIRNDGANNILIQGDGLDYDLQTPISTDFFDEGFDHIVVGDWNNDGKDDLFLIRNDGVNNILIQVAGPSFEFLDLNLPRAYFDEGFDHIVAGDWNNDGKDDLFMIRNDGANNILIQGDGLDYDLQTPISTDFFDEGFDHVVVGDWNNDGKDDLFLIRNDGVNNILIQVAGPSFEFLDLNLPRAYFDQGFDHIVVGDWNNAGKDDLFMIRNSDGANNVLIQGDGLDYDLQTSISTDFFDEGFDHVVVGDWNNDGRDDLFLIRNEGGVNNILAQENGPSFRFLNLGLPTAYFNQGFNHIVSGDWNKCPDVSCPDPQFETCGSQQLIPQGGSNYYVEANDPNFDFNSPWYINNVPAEDASGVTTDPAGDQLNCNFTVSGRYTICYPYLDADGCTNYCCETYCIETQSNVSIDYSYSPGSGFTFTLTGASSAREIEWYEDRGSISFLGGGVVAVSYPVPPGNCRTRTFFVRYFDAFTNCYRTVRWQIFICDPFACFDIDYAYNPVNGAYQLDLQAAGSAQNISWQDDDSGQTYGNNITAFIPISGSCGYRNISVRYRIGNVWRICCIRVYICNPFNCNDITYDYNRGTGRFDLDFSGSAVTSSITWVDDDAGGATISSGATSVSIPSRPSGSCGLRNISIRYYDGSAWRVCCLRYWDCNPYDCANFTTQTNEAAEALRLTFNGVNASQISWRDDVTGQVLPNSAGQTVVPLPWPSTGCQTRLVSIRYFDSGLGVFRICCIGVEVCRPAPCDDPVFATCNNQSYYLQTDGGYRISTSNPGFTTQSEWYVNDEPASEADFTIVDNDEVITCYFPGPGTYRVCYPYLDDFGCLQYCCQNYCVENLPQFEPTAFELTGDAYSLSLDVAGATDAQWYYWQGNTQVSLAAGSVVTLPFPTVCYTRTFYCRYFDAAGCWRVVSRRVVICDPVACGNIAYRFNPQNNAFDLTLESASATAISWFDDDNGTALPGNQGTITIDVDDECGPRNISVRYFDGFAWRICCLRYDACNPFACNLIVPRYDAQTNRYELTLTEADGLEQFSWSDDDNANISFTATGADLDILVAGPCRRRNISVRYYDPVNQVWGVCCVSYWQCLPDACGTAIADVALNDNEVRLSVDASFTNVSWTLAGADAGAGNAIEAGIATGQTRRVCVRYFDPAAGYWRTCCRDVINPECNLPVPAFSFGLSTIDSVSFANTNVTSGETYVWRVDGTPVTSTAHQLTLHLPPGQHEICLIATNDCGSRTICRTIILPDLATDLIFDIDEDVCGDPGTVIEVPMRVRNFRDVDAFQFTLSLGSGRVGKFLGIDYQLSGGSLNHLVVNDSTMALIWIQTSTASTTRPDGTVLGNIQIELATASPGDAVVTYAAGPTEPLYGLTGGSLGTPILVNGSYAICLADASLSGLIRRESGSGVAQVEVALSRNGTVEQTTITDLSGTYEFTGLTPGIRYTVTPMKDINHRNGVNAGDMSRIRRHIFGIASLSSPYQRIAANVINFDGIEATDISQLRQLIFQQITRFQEVSSWHFVPAAYQFPDPNNPLTPAYPTEVEVTVGSGMNASHDFIAIKMGDIDNSALRGQKTSSGALNKAASNLKFIAAGGDPHLGMTYKVDILTEDFTEMTAAQFSLGWNPEVLRFDSLGDLNTDLALEGENFSFDATNEGQLPWLWFGDGRGTLPDSTAIFSLYFTVIGEAGQTAEVNFTESPTEFYFSDTEGEVLSNFSPVSGDIQFPVSNGTAPAYFNLGISPNPADEFFMILGDNDLELDVVRLFDARGRLVREWAHPQSEQPYSTQELSGGLYFLEMRSDFGRQTERLIVHR